jgi:hypothetical protein
MERGVDLQWQDFVPTFIDNHSVDSNVITGHHTHIGVGVVLKYKKSKAIPVTGRGGP